MFSKIFLDYTDNLFSTLINNTKFEDITQGRKGAILVNPINNIIPIVRTTSKYQNQVLKFQSIHNDIINKIQKESGIDIIFNNAMIELYDNTYCKMGFHSDLELDLELESYIAIYSCYENPTDTSSYRKLIIKNKISNVETKIIMDHNSVILFDLSFNRNHHHKIILENVTRNNNWIGITFRLSKTFIHHIDSIPYFYGTDKILKLADDDETRSFYLLRSKENKNINFIYPEIDYTISESDLKSIK